MNVRDGRAMGILEYIIGGVVTIFAIGFTAVMGVILIILPSCGFLWAFGKQIWNLELPRVPPIDAIVMTVFLGIPIFALLWVVVNESCESNKGKT